MTLYIYACTTLSLDSVSTSNSRIVPSIAALGGGIGGALLLLATILLLTICSIAWCCHQTKESKTGSHNDQLLQGKRSDTKDKKLKSDLESELMDNEAYSSTTCYIPTNANVAYTQTVQISTEDNVAYYSQTALQISTGDNLS